MTADFNSDFTAYFDVGTFVANIAFSLVAVRVAADDKDEEDRLLEMISAAWLVYKAEMGMHDSNAYWSDDSRSLFLERAAGFAGCELIRRVIGAAHVDDLEKIPAGKVRDDAELAALYLGQQLVKTRNTSSAELAERIAENLI